MNTTSNTKYKLKILWTPCPMYELAANTLNESCYLTFVNYYGWDDSSGNDGFSYNYDMYVPMSLHI